MSFKAGDLVVHPHHGVGHVTKLEEKQFVSGDTRLYYEISLPGSTLWVPVDLQPVGLRKLAKKSDIAQGRRLLKSPAVALNTDPRLRQSDLTNQLKQGTLAARCEVIRDLTAHSWQKPLSGESASILRNAQDVLCQEWAIVEGITRTEAEQEIGALLKQGRQACKDHDTNQGDKPSAENPTIAPKAHSNQPAVSDRRGLHSG